MISRIVCIWTVLCCGILSAAAAEEAPAWLRQAAASSLPSYDKKVSFVVLNDEERITVNEGGLVTRACTHAIKILLKEGKNHAKAHEIYKTDTDKIREFRAWLIRPGGEVKKYEKNDTVDAALANNDVYNNARQKVISAESEVTEGAVFGFESVVEERSVFGQFEWFFQSHEPSLLSRLTVALPAGWTAEAATFNHAEIKPVVSGGTYVWEMKDLPYIEPEPSSPSATNIVPRLAVSIFPPAGSSSQLRSFKNWTDVSRWLTELSDPQVVLSDAMVSKAKELVASAQSELDKIGAIARFSQDINYVSIQMGIGRGGGYQPHAATEVFSKAYGDCKDKANLMRALLKAVGITAYPVSIFSGNRYYVREEWPSPQQFNHCIIAVKVSDSVKAPAIVRHEKLGSLLIFDPTDSNTRLGDIPGYEQGSLALIVAGDSGGIMRMPVSPPEANRTERRLELELRVDGSIQAQVQEEMTGEAATMARAESRELTKDAYGKMIEAWVSRNVRGALITKVDFQPDNAGGHSTLDVHFSAARYGQLMQGKLLMFNPTIVARRNSVDLTESSRKLPIVLESRAFTETLQLKLPPGFIVDEMPEAVDIKTDFGSYHAECDSKEGSLSYRRSLVMNNAVLPAEKYGEVRKFYSSIQGFEQSPVVLLKK
jgi:hypothetical protein